MILPGEGFDIFAIVWFFSCIHRKKYVVIIGHTFVIRVLASLYTRSWGGVFKLPSVRPSCGHSRVCVGFAEFEQIRSFFLCGLFVRAPFLS